FPERLRRNRRALLGEELRAALADERMVVGRVVRHDVTLRPDLEGLRGGVVLVHVRGELPPFVLVVLDHVDLLVPREDRQLLERAERRRVVAQRALPLGVVPYRLRVVERGLARDAL